MTKNQSNPLLSCLLRSTPYVVLFEENLKFKRELKKFTYYGIPEYLGCPRHSFQIQLLIFPFHFGTPLTGVGTYSLNVGASYAYYCIWYCCTSTATTPRQYIPVHTRTHTHTHTRQGTPYISSKRNDIYRKQNREGPVNSLSVVHRRQLVHSLDRIGSDEQRWRE